MTDVTLTFPDGAQRKIARGTTGADVARSISPSLAKRTVAMQLDGSLADLADPIIADATINFVSRTDPAAVAGLLFCGHQRTTVFGIIRRGVGRMHGARAGCVSSVRTRTPTPAFADPSVLSGILTSAAVDARLRSGIARTINGLQIAAYILLRTRRRLSESTT